MSKANKDGRLSPGDIDVMYANTGDVHTVTAGATNGVFRNTTWDGSTGSSAYTIGDIVAALKAAGILKA